MNGRRPPGRWSATIDAADPGATDTEQRGTTDTPAAGTRVWLVERTCSDDEGDVSTVT